MKKLLFIGSIFLMNVSVLCSEASTKELQAEKQFICTYEDCKKSFATSFGLYVHLGAMHSSVNFKCRAQDCQMAFVSSSGLGKHKNTHIGECRYVCNYPNCAAKYNVEFTLNKHKKIAHPQSKDVAPDKKDEAGTAPCDEPGSRALLEDFEPIIHHEDSEDDASGLFVEHATPPIQRTLSRKRNADATQTVKRVHSLNQDDMENIES